MAWQQKRKMQTRIMGGACHSYEEALGIISEYVETELSPPRENRTKRRRSMSMSDNQKWSILQGGCPEGAGDLSPQYL